MVLLFEQFTETKKNSHVIYKDKNLTIKIPKTLDASINISDPQWCSVSASGFYKHNLTSNLFRFIFNDGYKLRLTWDYLPWDGHNFSTGTHCGQGGEVDGVKKNYYHIRPKNESEPFKFNYNKGDDRQEMVDRIISISKSAIEMVDKYQKEHNQEKNALYMSMYKDVGKIKVIDVIKQKDHPVYYNAIYDISISYYGKIYKLLCKLMGYKYNDGSISFGFSKDFKKDFKNKYAFYEHSAIYLHLEDEVIKWLEEHNEEEHGVLMSLKYGLDNLSKLV
jgi:hypothetical protein